MAASPALSSGMVGTQLYPKYPDRCESPRTMGFETDSIEQSAPNPRRTHQQTCSLTVWTFVAPDEHGDHDVAYVFAGDRSGETPKRLLGGTKGTLIVDAYSGYNVVDKVSKRKHAACHAHLRRYFHEALPTAPIAQEAIDLILGLYRVEHDAKAQEITGTKAHLRLRRQRAGPIRDELHEWLLRQKPRHPPKSPISTAIRYALNQWRELGRFLDDARVPLDNNASERSLRRVALGRKNYLFVGDVDAV